MACAPWIGVAPIDRTKHAFDILEHVLGGVRAVAHDDEHSIAAERESHNWLAGAVTSEVEVTVLDEHELEGSADEDVDPDR